MDQPSPIKYMKIREAAERLAVAENTIRNAIHHGRLTAYKIMGTYRIRPDDLEAFVATCRVSSRSATTSQPASAATKARRFKHLDAQRSLASWQRQGVVADRQDECSAPSSSSSCDPSTQRAS